MPSNRAPAPALDGARTAVPAAGRHARPPLLGLPGRTSPARAGHDRELDIAGRMSVEPTEMLLRRIRTGDAQARQSLYNRCLPLLLRWAHGRLPHYARTASDTEDLVQTTLMRALKHLDAFESSGSGAFLAYLRQILLNEVRREIRSQHRHGTQVPVDGIELRSEGLSSVELMVNQERLQAYERALASLAKRQQELVLLRIEFGMSYLEIAQEVGGTPDAVRMSIARSLQKMAEVIGDELG
jgi:RNA polymerase sigma factor (sigma-70 family)